MPLPVPARINSLREPLLAAVGPLALLAATNSQLDAVANRFVNKLGVKGVNFRLSNLVDTVLKPAAGAGKVEINDLIVAIVALVMLGAIVYFLFGVLKTLGGRRGGLEAVGQVVFALIIAIAGLEVLA
jgi:Flp pilus assembly pilin Flp